MSDLAKPLGLSIHFNSQLINRMFEMILVSVFGLFVVMNKICSGPYMIVVLHCRRNPRFHFCPPHCRCFHIRIPLDNCRLGFRKSLSVCLPAKHRSDSVAQWRITFCYPTVPPISGPTTFSYWALVNDKALEAIGAFCYISPLCCY